MSYENALSTKMLASRCCVCSRSLRDAVSVELGIGPVCRTRHGFDIDCNEENRKRANQLVHLCAVNLHDEDARRAACSELYLLGFILLAKRIEFRGKDAPANFEITIEEYTVPAVRFNGRNYPARTGLLVKAPYCPAALDAWRNIPGRIFVREHKANFVPNTERRATLALLKRYHAGASAHGPKGAFAI